MTTKANEGDLRVWWVPQLPCPAFEVSVPDLQTADLLMSTLANYDLFQFEHRIRPDYCNTGGLQVFENGEWCDWSNADGESFDDVRQNPGLMKQAVKVLESERQVSQ
jgi:hypothetical protein